MRQELDGGGKRVHLVPGANCKAMDRIANQMVEDPQEESMEEAGETGRLILVP